MRAIRKWFQFLIFLGAVLLGRTKQKAAEDRQVWEAPARHVEEEAEAVLPQPTIWPLILAVAIMMGLWGIILNNFFFGVGMLLAFISVVGWMNVELEGGAEEYTESNPHESWKSE